MLTPMVCRAYLLLIRTDVYLRGRHFPELYEWVRQIPVGRNSPREGTAEAVFRAVDLASVWYRRQVLCLQRSAAAVWLLRRSGIKAQMVIGVQPKPFRGHAW